MLAGEMVPAAGIQSLGLFWCGALCATPRVSNETSHGQLLAGLNAVLYGSALYGTALSFGKMLNE
jgi:hypothetical protein